MCGATCRNIDDKMTPQQTMPPLLTDSGIVDRLAYAHTVEHLRERHIVLPTFAELASGAWAGRALDQLVGVDPDAPDFRNLSR